ncbi:PRKR-interacting protein 1 homolog [Ixodes scapularis]
MADAEPGEDAVLGVVSKPPPKKKKPEQGTVVVPKTVYDVQRLKLERLMQNPDKPVLIPDRPKGRSPHDAPEFVRNVMGSSAGAGSGEFHVYRHLRRKEYARQKYIDQKARQDEKDQEFRERVERNKRLAEERTAKKRAKRLKRKAKLKDKKKQTGGQGGCQAHGI